MNHPAMPSELLRHLADREDDARAEADRLSAQITELTTRLQEAEQVLTRQTLLEIADQPHEDRSQTTQPPLPPAYQEILGVFTHTDGRLRAKDLCTALDIGDQPRHIEAMRAKLKRLVGRDILTEPEPGLFTMNRRES